MRSTQRRTPRFDGWKDVLADVETLHADGYQRLGELSLGQICNHLAIVLEGAVDGYPSRLPGPVRWLLRTLVLGRMMKHMQTGLRVPSPSFAAQTEPVADDAGIARLRSAIERFTDPGAEYDVHPMFGRLTREQWKHQQLWHCEHHLSFLIPRHTDESAAATAMQEDPMRT